MKPEKLITVIVAAVLITGTAMNILHVPYSIPVILSGFAAISLFQTWQVSQLKKRIKELESKV
ncbi:MAG: hypothetical protein ACOZCO_00545 [Bacteroidota bacterium]